jgi:hypothetical protein
MTNKIDDEVGNAQASGAEQHPLRIETNGISVITDAECSMTRA